MSISIQDFLAVIRRIHCDSKDDCLKKISEELAPVANISQEELLGLFKTRELLGSTGLGDGFALPHVKSENIHKLVGGLFLLDKGIDFNAVDNTPVNIIFAFLAPSIKPAIQLKAMAKIAKVFKPHEFKETILKAQTEREVKNLIARREKEIS